MRQMRSSSPGLCILLERSTHIQRKCSEWDLYRDPWKSLRLCRLLHTCRCFPPESAEGRSAGLFSVKLTFSPGLPIQCSNFYLDLHVHRVPVVSTAAIFVHILRKETRCPHMKCVPVHSHRTDLTAQPCWGLKLVAKAFSGADVITQTFRTSIGQNYKFLCVIYISNPFKKKQNVCPVIDLLNWGTNTGEVALMKNWKGNIKLRWAPKNDRVWKFHVGPMWLTA